MKTVPVVLVCPCCASPVDALAQPDTEPGHRAQRRLTCVACGQQWAMTIDLDRIAKHTLT